MRKIITKTRLAGFIACIAICLLFNVYAYSQEINGDIDKNAMSIAENTTVDAGITKALNNILAESNITAKEELLYDGESAVVENEEIIVASQEVAEDTSEEDTQEEDEYIVNTDIDPYVMYVGSEWLRLRESPDANADNVIKLLHPGLEITVIGETDFNWVLIYINEDTQGYVCSDYIQDTSPEEATYNYNWYGEKLNSQNGKVSGPSGNETYYNLDMSRVIYYMNCLGYYYDYWVRSDGVKMFGNYVMVAADLSQRPKGTLVETTLGTGIVVDTGEFVCYDPTRLDVAVTW